MSEKYGSFFSKDWEQIWPKREDAGPKLRAIDLVRGGTDPDLENTDLELLFGQMVSPFVHGIYLESYDGLPEVNKAYGFSSSYLFEDLGSLRVELFEEEDFRVSRPINSSDSKLKNYDHVLAVRVEPVLYFEDPDDVFVDMEAVVKIRSQEYVSGFSWAGGHCDLALFENWEKPGRDAFESLWIYSPQELQEMQIKIVNRKDFGY